MTQQAGVFSLANNNNNNPRRREAGLHGGQSLLKTSLTSMNFKVGYKIRFP